MVVRKNEQPIPNSNDTIDEDTSTEVENASNYLIIVHVFDHCVQDSEAVVAILRDVLIHTKRVDGKLVLFSKTERPDIISTIICSDTPNSKTVLFTTTQIKNKQHDLSNQSTNIHKNTYVSRLFDCYEERCVKKFLDPEIFSTTSLS